MDTAKRSPVDRLLFSNFLKKIRRLRKKPTKSSMTILPIHSSAIFRIYWQSPSRPMMMSRSCMTASTKLRQHWDRTAPMCSAHCLQS